MEKFTVVITDIFYSCEIELDNGQEVEGYIVNATINGHRFWTDESLTKEEIKSKFNLSEAEFIVIYPNQIIT